MYNSLLLSNGGGIVSNTQKSIQDDAPVLVIGVGGTGAKALSTLKNKVHKQLEPDNPDSTVPTYEHIRFLEIDSDAEWVEGTDLDSNQEFINLQDPNVRRRFTNDIEKADLKKQPQFKWLEVDDIRIPESLHGAGGIRQLGRYMIVNSSQQVYTKIRTNIENAIRGKEAKDLVIHIMAGISGGMGSGCFLDVCYIVRKVLQDLAIDAAVVFGYFFLPDVITTIPAISTNTNKIKANYTNGYAALVELDHLMNLRENHGRFQQNYGGFSVDTDMAPVDMCHLVSALDASGNSKPNGFKYCMNVVADYVMSYLSKPEQYDESITPKGNLANINHHVDLIKVEKGAYNRYHILGASNAEMPMTQVATYLATQLYEKMRGYLKKLPVDQDVVNFAENTMSLKLAELKRMLAKDVKLAREVPCPEMSTVKNITASHVHAESILKPMNDWLSAQEGTIERNYRGLDAEVKNYVTDPNATSLIGILYNKLADLALNPSYGPYYAIGMLSRTGKDLNAILQGLHLEVDKLCKDAERQADFQSTQVEEAKREFTSSRNTLLNRNIEKNAYDAYRDQMGIWYRRRLDVTMYRYVDKLILGLQKKADDMYKQYFGRMKTFLDELDATFIANGTYFEGGHGDDPSDDGFTIRIMKFSDIKPHLDAVIMEERPEDAAIKMIKFFLDNSDDWLSGEEYRIGRMVNKFISERFSEEMNKGMQEYLKEKYPGKEEAERVKELQKDLFQPLMHASVPLFWSSTTIDSNNSVETINLSYPMNVTDIVTAAENFRLIYPETSMRKCNIGDRMFMLRIYSGLALYRYHGLDLMKQEYDKGEKEGLHLFGKGTVNWKNLPTPIPYSLNAKAVKGGEGIEKAFEKAKEINILKITRSEEEGTVDACVLKKPILEDKVAIEFLHDLRCLGENKIQEFKDLEDVVLKEVQEKYFTDGEEISEKALSDWENRVKKLRDSIKMGQYEEYTVAHYKQEEIALDNVIHSPLMTQILLETVEMYEATDVALSCIDKLYEIIQGESQDINNFCNALFTGVLKQGIGKIYFTYEERHVERELTLASKSMPYGSYLYYQAFCSFKDMDERVKEEVFEQAKQRVDNLQEGDDAIALKILQKCTPRDMADLEKQYTREKQSESIKAFYTKFVDLLYEFTDQFR